ncbi:MAG: hypothetical protein IPL36_01285 [Nigerium sp.]|nr:hypothetical protein [Nigerium sp.]
MARRFDPLPQTLECCAAWLHDVIGHTDITADDLTKAGVHPEAIEVVLLLTRHDGQGDEYYERIADHDAALAVKPADLAHNTAPDRVAQLAPETRAKLQEKYDRAYALLGCC